MAKSADFYLTLTSMTVDLVKKALENAYLTQKPDDGDIFHSDLGSQYTCDDFAEVIQNYKMTHSFSRKGSPYDNACIESFHAILKKRRSQSCAILRFKQCKNGTV